MTAFMNIPSPLFFLELSVASITEEVVFRGLLAYILRHRRVWVNIFFSSLIFSASHIPKFALLLCAHLREEFAVDVMTAATGSSCVDEDPAGTLQRNSKIIEEKELETRQLAARQAQKLFDSPRNVSRLNQIQREVLKDLALNLAITMGFGMLIGCLYRTVYQLQLAPLIIAHLLCNLFGIPKFYCLRMNKTPFENKFIMWITVGCYICGVAGWLKMILVS